MVLTLQIVSRRSISEGENLNETEATTEAEAIGTEELIMKSNEAYETFHPNMKERKFMNNLLFSEL